MTLYSPHLVIQRLISNWNLMEICEGEKAKREKRTRQAIEFEKKF